MRRLLPALMAVVTLFAVSPTLAQEATDSGLARREVLVSKYLAAIEFDKLIDGMMDQMMQAQMAQLPASVTPDIRTAIIDAADEAMAEVWPEMMDRYITLHAETLSEEELMAMVRFYESDLGRSITAKSQVLAVQSGPIIQEFMPRMQTAMLRRMCAKVKCPAAS